MQAHIDNILIPTYQSRYKVLLTAIKTQLEPLGVRITTGAPYMTPKDGEILPAGGFFTYISFPDEFPSADIIAKKAKDEYALTFAHGEMFVVKGDPVCVERSGTSFGRGARLCWAWHEEAEIEEGVRRLGELLGTLLEKPT
jgi:DNA-binding transcriptional MocR family regulator